jgi:predicted Rossmann fold flavoprotein
VFDVIIAGGGAAGFFAAINLCERNPDLKVAILEKSGKLLSKVRVSGGGRCNVTHNCTDNRELSSNYPRGDKELFQAFSRFSVNDTIQWFIRHGVALKTEDDNRMFPVTDDSETIAGCFLHLAKTLGVTVRTGCEIHHAVRTGSGFRLSTGEGAMECKNLVIATGGFNKLNSYSLPASMGHSIVPPVPSLFTFNLSGESLCRTLQGISVRHAAVSLPGIHNGFTGPLLVTHWGLSGPAVLKLSAFAAIPLHERNYEAEVKVNWTGLPLSQVVSETGSMRDLRPRSAPVNTPLFDIPARLWEFLCNRTSIGAKMNWSETGKKDIAALANELTGSIYKMKGKTTFKEEFVSCGGVDTGEVDFRTMESRKVTGLYFCGEVLNIDGVTGGFNFQAAWTTAYICAAAIAGGKKKSH